jgi:hypothetical protein
MKQRVLGFKALQVDKVLCDGQLERLGIEPSLFPGRRESVRPVSHRRFEDRHITFRALEAKTLNSAAVYELAHLAGTAEIRSMLSATEQIEAWVAGMYSHTGNEPDARAVIAGVPLLVEFDTCSYDARIVRKKMRAFRKEGQVVWGTTSALRADRLGQKYPEAAVLYVPWWEGPEERVSTLAAAGDTRGAERKAQRLERQARRSPLAAKLRPSVSAAR